MTPISDKPAVKIRKPCQCFGCEEVMPPGSIIARRVYAEDGHIWTTNWCSWCNEYLEYGDEIYFGELKQTKAEELRS